MAYAAVVSLKHTIRHLKYSSDVSVDLRIIRPAKLEVKSLLKHFKEVELRGKKYVNALDEGLREVLHKFEDIIESHVATQLLSKSLRGHPRPFSVDLKRIKPQIQTLTVELKKMKSAYLRESRKMDGDDFSSRLIDFGGNKLKIVGFFDEVSYIKGKVLLPEDLVRTKVLTLVGMAGIGKSTLAKEIFEDPDVVKSFESRVWVSVGRKKCKYVEIARRILAQLNLDSNILVGKGDEEISRVLQKILNSKRCLVVLDDVWDTEFINDVLVRHKPRRSWVIFTTRLQRVAMMSTGYQIRLMNKEESWNLFCGKVFGEELCPHELVKPGKKIAEKCEGLPLLIVAIANLLSKSDNDLEYWNKVAEDKQNRLLKDACKEIEEVLLPSYDHLPQYLKLCFLYMGAFPQDYEIPKSNILNLWTAEWFLELADFESSDSHYKKCLSELVLNNVVLLYQKSSNPLAVNYIVKTCGLHCSFWHMCNREAEKNKFLHVLNIVEDSLEESIKGHRRLCVHNNVLFGMKDVYTSIQHVCASTARSLLCFGPYHEYAVPICFGLRLLKVLDALAIRFYEFPLEVLKLVLLRYLALTYSGKLPPSISKLWKLEFLIVRRHMSIKSSGAPSYLPVEIWDMKKLEHLQIMGSDLPDPCGNLLPKLLRLIGVSAQSCTKEVLQGIPNLEKLGILIELEPHATESLRCFDHISNLNELRSLKCAVVNPMIISPRATPIFKMPPSLQKLHLSGLGYPWKYMTIIAASLPNLRELKLRSYAFRGPKWDTKVNHFPKLAFLLIEDTDLVQLKTRRGSFPKLKHISMKHCYRLQELHLDYCASLEQIELVDCNPLAVSCVNRRIENESTTISKDGLLVHSSWNDGNLKSSQATNWSKRTFLKAW